MSYKYYQQATKPVAMFLMGDATPFDDYSGNAQVANTKSGSTNPTLGVPLVAGAANSSIFDNTHVGEFTCNFFQQGMEERNWQMAAWVLPVMGPTAVKNLEIVPQPGAAGAYNSSTNGWGTAPTITNNATGGPINNGPYKRYTAASVFTPPASGVFMLQQLALSGLTATGSLAANPNDVYTMSLYVRSSVTQTVQPMVVWLNSAGGSPGSTGGSDVTLVANTWTRVSVTSTAAPATTAAARLDLRAGAATRIAWAIGNTLDIGAVEITSGSTLFNYFDGANPPLGETGTTAWDGTTNASTSTWNVAQTQQILSHTGQTDGLTINGNVLRFSTDYLTTGSAACTYDLQTARKAFVVVSHTFSANEMWVNGELVAHVDITNAQKNDSFVATTNKLYCGTSVSSTAKVALNAVSFYNSLTSEEIAMLWQAGNNTVPQAKIAPQFSGDTYNLNRDFGTYYFDQTWADTSDFSLGDINTIGVSGDLLTPILDGTLTSIAGNWKTAVALDNSGASSIYGVALQWSGSGVSVDVSLDGTTWTPAVNGNLVSIITNGMDPTGKDMHIRVSFAGGIYNDPSYLDSIRAIGFLDNTFANSLARPVTLVAPAVLRDDYEPILYRDDNGVKLSSTTLTIGTDTSSEPKTARTIEIWLKVLSGTPTFNVSGTNYRNGAVDATFPVGEWMLLHRVAAADIATSITITGDVIVGQVTIYPTALTAANVSYIWSSYTGKPFISAADASAITITEPGSPALIYAHDWSVDGGSG